MKRRLLFSALSVSALLLALWANGADEKSHKLTNVSIRKMADSLRAVITADQRTYVELAVGADGSAARASDHARVLRRAAQSIQQAGAEFSYTLRSLTPLDPNNGPQTESEQTGLEFVNSHPGENYYAEEELGGRSYFTAVYAEHAAVAACVECHNAHPKSTRRDLKLGDVVGGVVVRVPLEF